MAFSRFSKAFELVCELAWHENRVVGVLIPPSAERSRNMAAIRSRDTKPEMFVRTRVHKAGYRFRLNVKDLPGTPDLVFPRLRLAVFVHGCFWHGHVCKEAKPAKSNASYWSPKIAGNMKRDRRSANRLRRCGWTVAIIRECDLERGVNRLLGKLSYLKARRSRCLN